MSDMTRLLESLKQCAVAEDPFYPRQEDAEAIDHAIAALTAKSDAELIAWGLRNALDNPRKKTFIELWRKDRESWLCHSYTAEGGWKILNLGERWDYTLTPAARAVLEAAMGEAEKGKSDAE